MRGGRSINKALIALILLLLFTSCGANIPLLGIRPNLPFRVWDSWEEMKAVLGDHYLYPTYLPEYAEWSKQSTLRSWYNNSNRRLHADELFFGYVARFWSGDTSDDFIEISATDYERMNAEPLPRSLDFPAPLRNRERFNDHIVTIGGVDINFFTLYGVFFAFDGHPDPDDQHHYHTRNARVVYYTFTIDSITYFMQWSQYNVDDKYADDAQREEMLRVATSIIEQAREVE